MAAASCDFLIPLKDHRCVITETIFRTYIVLTINVSLDHHIIPIAMVNTLTNNLIEADCDHVLYVSHH